MARHDGPRARARKRLAALAAAAAFLLSGCAGKVITKSGHDSADLYNVVLVMATIVFVAVEAAIIWQVVKYRRRRGAEQAGLPPQIHGNTQIEIVWTALPSIIIAILFVLSIIGYTKVNAESASPDLTVKVTGFQWQWRFDYLKDGKPVVTENAQDQDHGPTLYLPTGRDIHFDLVSGTTGTNDVIHSFFVPAFFFKRDVVPGRTNHFDETLVEGTEGQYVGECAEFCGDFHNAMTFTVQVMSPASFDTWFAEAAKKQAQGPQCSPNGDTVKVVAKGIKFDTDCLAAPADQDFTIDFDNQDAGVPHNVDVYDEQGGSHVAGAQPSELLTGPGTTTYKVSSLKAGTYFFQCDVHPSSMFGTFIVK